MSRTPRTGKNSDGLLALRTGPKASRRCCPHEHGNRRRHRAHPYAAAGLITSLTLRHGSQRKRYGQGLGSVSAPARRSGAAFVGNGPHLSRAVAASSSAATSIRAPQMTQYRGPHPANAGRNRKVCPWHPRWWPPKSALTEVRRASGRPLWMNITHLCIAQISFLKVFTFDYCVP